MGVLTRGLNITRHPLTVTNPLQLLVCIFEIFVASGSIRFACLVLISIEALSMVLSYALGHGGSLGTTEKHIRDKVSCGCMRIFCNPFAAHQAEICGFQALNLLHGDELVGI